MKRHFVAVLLLSTVTANGAQAEPDVLSVTAQTTHGPQQPSAVPVLPGLNVGKQWVYGPLVGLPVGESGYRPVNGDGYAKHNGSGRFNRIMTTGSWWLLVGDRPQMKITVRTAAGAYAQPGLLPDLGVSGQLRVAVGSGDRTKWLDEFDAIDVVLDPTKAVESFEFRCVTTQSLLGILGATMLEAN